ncbi:glucans biosynthesis glucosyltransferase MdoH [Tateyamaria omphalii]|uniref:glucans biosynthesis glucosyltransferase MdoH n=1 Tax=Tateyamaria omphalii TaxID=299262 RepID=UPI001C98E5A1|nr:glucans biosynthesis glucosyltransferase MdoH [Tateyamaria omphalii]MBY5933922.1 glucans biosynthesis glucosyltransferase MdoH [Tateyamaria omphalii]
MIHAAMPPRAPLAMPAQDFARAPAGADAGTDRQDPIWRLAVFLPALAITGGVLWGLYGFFAMSGMTGFEYVLLTLIGLTFIWVTIAVSTVGVGLAGRLDAGRRPPAADPLDVALLVPIYNETPWDVFGNATAMLNDLMRQKGGHRYSLFILSDTTDEAIAAQEWDAFQALKARAPLPVYYRRRAQNTDKKVGNLVDWITGWGASYEAMLVLDADSLMTGRAIDRLSTELAADPKAGLIQSFPQLIGANTLFARMQQFSNIAYGWLLAEGLAHWARTEGNYWGHNAIIRTHAFASSAGLPYLRGLSGRSDLILSHDFVEASLLRRAGWRVRFLPRISGSFEETPGTLIDYVIRDRRWCRGNLQHLRLLTTRGLHPVSRFHLFQGAAAYLMSPAWFVLLVFWALLGRDAETNVISYFNEANPLFPNWPPAMTHIDSAIFLVVMYAMLLLPKITSALIIAANGKAVRLFGGRRVFAGAVLTELALSVAYAPIMMIQQTKAVIGGLMGRGGWTPQSRTAQAYPMMTLIKFHWIESMIGGLLFIGLGMGLVSWWLIPIAVSLAFAVPLSGLSAYPLARIGLSGLRLDNPLTLREPAIVINARTERAEMRARIEAQKIAAE